jgi:hypothetical protein
MAVQSPQTQKWPDRHAVLFVHGVGNAQPGDYGPLVAQVEELLGDDANKFAIYFLYYDQVNNWFAQKEQLRLQCAQLVRAIGKRLDGSSLGNVIADFGGDVIWPVLLADARLAVRTAVLQQLQQIVLDGKAANVQPRNQHLSVIAHSMGCFHVYEALMYAAATPAEGLGPASAGIVLDNLIFMASPVQLIRTVAGELGSAVPQRESIFSVSAPALEIPWEPGGENEPVRCARRTVSIAGNLDPVSGYFLRKPLAWAYMNLPDQLSFIDQEQVGATVDGAEKLSLTSVLQSALRQEGPPNITPMNPHDWSAYVQRHATDLRTWLV